MSGILGEIRFACNRKTCKQRQDMLEVWLSSLDVRNKYYHENRRNSEVVALGQQASADSVEQNIRSCEAVWVVSIVRNSR